MEKGQKNSPVGCFPDELGRGRLNGRTKGGMNTTWHAMTDAQGRPILTLG